MPLEADGAAACSVAAKARYPIITIPVSINNRMSFGIGIIQTLKEHLLLSYWSAIEDLVEARNLPQFLNFEAEN